MAKKTDSLVSISRSSYASVDIDALVAPLGGWKQFVSSSDRVVLKLNLLNASTPEEGVVTHPQVVRAVCKGVLAAGGVPIIADSPGGPFTKRRLERVYKKAGLDAVSRDLGVELNFDTSTKKIVVDDGQALKKTSVCSFCVDADRIIAIPKLKTHSFQMLTLATKIMYGVIPGLRKATYHSRFMRRDAFADMLLDILDVVPVDLYVLDGIEAMEGEGPGGGTIKQVGVLMAATDPVAMDISVCHMLGIEPVGVPTLKQAKLRGLWSSAIQYPLLQPSDVLVKDFKLPSTAGYLLTGKKAPERVPHMTEACVACGECEKICPVNAISIPADVAVVDYSKCIRCYCCHEICAYRAVSLEKQ